MSKSFFLVILTALMLANSVVSAGEAKTVYRCGFGIVVDSSERSVLSINDTSCATERLVVRTDSQTIVSVYIDSVYKPIYEGGWDEDVRQILLNKYVATQLEIADTKFTDGIEERVSMLRKGTFLIVTGQPHSFEYWKAAKGKVNVNKDSGGSYLTVGGINGGYLNGTTAVVIFTEKKFVHKGGWGTKIQALVKLVNKKGREVFVIWSENNDGAALRKYVKDICVYVLPSVKSKK